MHLVRVPDVPSPDIEFQDAFHCAGKWPNLVSTPMINASDCTISSDLSPDDRELGPFRARPRGSESVSVTQRVREKPSASWLWEKNEAVGHPAWRLPRQRSSFFGLPSTSVGILLKVSQPPSVCFLFISSAYHRSPHLWNLLLGLTYPRAQARIKSHRTFGA